MLIEIYGAGFANKGAQLMLETVVERCRTANPAVELAVEPGWNRPPTKVHRLGVQMLCPAGAFCGSKKGLNYQLATLISRLVTWKKVRPYGIVSRYDVDALIDISGYAFGDFWGTNQIGRFVPLAEFYRKRGRPVILLPQMLGPFENAEVRDLFQTLAKTASMIYARDNASHSCASKAAPASEIRLAPDITISSSKHEEKLEMNPTRVCIVPNVRVVDAGERPMKAEKYLELLMLSAKQVLDAGKEVVIVVHEYFGKDAVLAEKLQVLLKGYDVQVIAEADPKKLKAYIGASRFLIGSRFHSAVAALSSGVPCIIIGWAHKYGELLADFDQERFDVSNCNGHASIAPLISELLDDEGHKANRSRIESAGEELKIKNEEMWDSVFETLGLSEAL